jgi:hypothetical protein
MIPEEVEGRLVQPPNNIVESVNIRLIMLQHRLTYLFPQRPNIFTSITLPIRMYSSFRSITR